MNDVLVKLLKKVPPYNAGEVIGLSPDVANRYVTLGVAVLAKPAGEPKVRQVSTQTRTVNKPARTAVKTPARVPAASSVTKPTAPATANTGAQNGN